MTVLGWRHLGRLAAIRTSVWLTAGLSASLAGCATSVHMPAFADDVTGSIAAPASPLSSALDPEDWRRAKGAMGLALDPQGNGDPVDWDNPQTGAKGAFTPVGAAYAREDKICRAFVAELSGSLAATKLQGTACRDGSGEWSLTTVRHSKS